MGIYRQNNIRHQVMAQGIKELDRGTIRLQGFQVKLEEDDIGILKDEMSYLSKPSQKLWP